jgi:exodeoxyribonuclease VIII
MSGNGKHHRHETYASYAAAPGVNWSTLKEMGRSPAHYHHRLITPRDDTSAMRMGRAIHAAALEPDAFPLEYTIYEGPRRAGKDWDEFARVNADKTILRAEEYETCLAVRDAVRRHKAARRMLRWGKAEVTLKWVDPQTRLRCKARLDWIAPGGVLIDLKSTRDGDPRVFGRLAERMGYHGQLAFYRRGLLASGHDPAPVYIIAVETEAPHDVSVFEVDEDVLLAGDLLVHDYLHQVRACRKRRSWPGRDPGVQKLDFPTWALPDGDAYSDLIEVLA